MASLGDTIREWLGFWSVRDPYWEKKQTLQGYDLLEDIYQDSLPRHDGGGGPDALYLICNAVVRKKHFIDWEQVLDEADANARGEILDCVEKLVAAFFVEQGNECLKVMNELLNEQRAATIVKGISEGIWRIPREDNPNLMLIVEKAYGLFIESECEAMADLHRLCRRSGPAGRELGLKLFQRLEQHCPKQAEAIVKTELLLEEKLKRNQNQKSSE